MNGACRFRQLNRQTVLLLMIASVFSRSWAQGPPSPREHQPAQPSQPPPPKTSCEEAEAATAEARAAFDASVADYISAQQADLNAIAAERQAEEELQAAGIAEDMGPAAQHKRISNAAVEFEAAKPVRKAADQAWVLAASRERRARAYLVQCLVRERTRCPLRPDAVAQKQPQLPAAPSPPAAAAPASVVPVSAGPTLPPPQAPCMQAEGACAQERAAFDADVTAQNKARANLDGAMAAAENAKAELGASMAELGENPNPDEFNTRFQNSEVNAKATEAAVQSAFNAELESNTRLGEAKVNLIRCLAGAKAKCEPKSAETQPWPPANADLDSHWGFSVETHLPPRSFDFSRGKLEDKDFLRGTLIVSPFCVGDDKGFQCDFFRGASREGEVYQMKLIQGPPGEKLDFGNFYPEHYWAAMRAVFDTGTVSSDPHASAESVRVVAPPNAKDLRQIQADFNIWNKKYTVYWIVSSPQYAAPAPEKP